MALPRPKRDRSAADFLPPVKTLPTLKKAAASCKGCDLYKRATQTVFGEGPKDALVVFVGEQPGDYEDKAGRPFVGPAGRMFDKALAEARLDRGKVYVTNAVKHFKWKPMGKRRKHEKPLASEINACFPWLESETQVMRPQIVVCLGATAAQSVLKKKVAIQKERGAFQESPLAPATFVTVHPSSIYRHPEKAQQELEYRRFVDDMKLVRAKLAELEKKHVRLAG
ncbi:MAG TPA: UdgX family uracil-DNA binding protein [Candidatus Binatia bacterium]|jgi:uracil-DNA glycosylase family protein|nr:UdgX family uracil-DNA binding protein [Candidatus Binatia bacterium]